MRTLLTGDLTLTSYFATLPPEISTEELEPHGRILHLAGVPVYSEFSFWQSSKVLPLIGRSYFACHQNSNFSMKETGKLFCEWMIRNFETLCSPESACFSEQDGCREENSYKYCPYWSQCKPDRAAAGTWSFCISAQRCVLSHVRSQYLKAI